MLVIDCNGYNKIISSQSRTLLNFKLDVLPTGKYLKAYSLNFIKTADTSKIIDFFLYSLKNITLQRRNYPTIKTRTGSSNKSHILSRSEKFIKLKYRAV